VILNFVKNVERYSKINKFLRLVFSFYVIIFLLGSENMKRLLKISFDALIFSFIPILSWFMLGLLVDKNLVNVFSLTYPFQFIWAMMNSIFGVGPNIYKEKHNNNNVVMSGMCVGIIVGFLIFGFIALNIDSYISFMNMDVSIYHNFALYSVIQLYIQLIFSIILQKLYYEDKNNLANKYTIFFNFSNFIILIVCSLIFKNQIYIITITLLLLLLFIIFILVREFNKFKFSFHLLDFIKYDSVDVCNNLFFFIIFLFGISNAASYGVEYMAALNFVALITDTQWDIFNSISTVAKIDIARGNFKYNEHRNNAYKLLGILLFSIVLLFGIMYPLYELNLILVLCYFLFEIVNFLIYPIYRIKTCFLQLEYSSLITTSNKFIASSLRTCLTFLKTPFCTGIGQVSSSIYQFITVNFLFYKNYKIDSDGNIIKNIMR